MADSMMKSILCVLAIFTSQSTGQGYGNIKDSQPQLIQEYQPMPNLGGYGGGLETPSQPELVSSYKQPELVSSYKQPGNGGFGLLNEPQQPLLQQQQNGGGYNTVPAPGYGQIQGGNTFMQPQEVGNYGNPVLINQAPSNSFKIPSSSGYGSTGPAYTQTQPLIQPGVINSGSGYGGQPPLVQQSNGYGKPQRQESTIIFKPGHPSPHSSPSYGVRPHNHGQSQFGQGQYGQSQYGSINRRPQAFSPQSYGGGRPQIQGQVPSHLNTYNSPISGHGYGNNNNGYGSGAPAVQPRPSY